MDVLLEIGQGGAALGSADRAHGDGLLAAAAHGHLERSAAASVSLELATGERSAVEACAAAAARRDRGAERVAGGGGERVGW